MASSATPWHSLHEQLLTGDAHSTSYGMPTLLLSKAETLNLYETSAYKAKTCWSRITIDGVEHPPVGNTVIIFKRLQERTDINLIQLLHPLLRVSNLQLAALDPRSPKFEELWELGTYAMFYLNKARVVAEYAFEMGKLGMVDLTGFKDVVRVRDARLHIHSKEFGFPVNPKETTLLRQLGRFLLEDSYVEWLTFTEPMFDRVRYPAQFDFALNSIMEQVPSLEAARISAVSSMLTTMSGLYSDSQGEVKALNQTIRGLKGTLRTSRPTAPAQTLPLELNLGPPVVQLV